MKKYITWERVIIAVLLILLGGMFYTGKTYIKENIALKLENQQLDSTKNALGQTVLQQEALIIKSNEDRASLLSYTDSLFNLTEKQERRIKDIVAFYKANTKTELVDVLVPYKDTIGAKKWADSIQRVCANVITHYENNYISVPRKAQDSTTNYIAGFTVDKKGVNIDSLIIPNEQSIRFVTIKGGFLKRDVYGKRHFILSKRIEVQVINSNPLIKTVSQSSAIYQPPKKLRLGEKAIFIAAGIYLGTKL